MASLLDRACRVRENQSSGAAHTLLRSPSSCPTQTPSANSSSSNDACMPKVSPVMPLSPYTPRALPRYPASLFPRSLSGCWVLGTTRPLLLSPSCQTPYAHAMIVHRTIVKFCQSNAPKIEIDHVPILRETHPSPNETGSRSRKPVKPPTERWVLERALEVWERMHPSLENIGRYGSNSGGGGNGAPFPKTFDSVLKVYQLSQPDLSLMYDVVMLDEAQDINECQADIISRQTKCRVIVVGDPHQARETDTCRLISLVGIFF